jgi:CRISPR system Cascade subunit CasE
VTPVLYLSRLILDPRCRRVRQELANPYELHRTVMAAFADGCRALGERVLFRSDPIPGDVNMALLVQSPQQPDWGFLQGPGASGYLAAGRGENPAVKEFTPSWCAGQVLAFRLRANPTVKRAGRRLGLYTETEQLAWLARKGQAAGFTPLGVTARQEDLVGGVIHREADDQHLQLLSVRFDGHLCVDDPDQLRAVLEGGVGSGKGFGFGLLSLARAQ